MRIGRRDFVLLKRWWRLVMLRCRMFARRPERDANTRASALAAPVPIWYCFRKPKSMCSCLWRMTSIRMCVAMRCSLWAKATLTRRLCQPHLSRRQHDPETSEWAVHAIGELGSAAGDMVLDELHKTTPKWRPAENGWDAATALWEIRGDVEKVLPVATRYRARRSAELRPAATQPLPALWTACESSNKHPFEDPLAARAAQLLGKMGAAGQTRRRRPRPVTRTIPIRAHGRRPSWPSAKWGRPLPRPCRRCKNLLRQADNRWQYIPSILKNIDPAGVGQPER